MNTISNIILKNFNRISLPAGSELFFSFLSEQLNLRSKALSNSVTAALMFKVLYWH